MDNHIDSEENIPKKIENKESFQMKDIDEIFSYTIASEITNDKDDPEPKSVM